ncbi:type II toxin-antitoxin system RelE/ParE family toxin [Nostoc sp.]|uniref:type II toxin-antitoxin system RelE/ParE family toxin n=1 Tax=Nostoc sp. TaxID=1180 RepID=UPI002FF64093
MLKVSFSSLFKRAFKKRIQRNVDLEARFWQKLQQFTADPFDQGLKTHKLLSKLKDLWSFSVDSDQRVVFYFTDDGNAVFVDIGSHDEVY